MSTDQITMLVPIVAIGGGILFLCVLIISKAITSTVRSKQVEESRREIAAYIAEGSMTPEEGERLLKATPKDLENV